MKSKITALKEVNVDTTFTKVLLNRNYWENKRKWCEYVNKIFELGCEYLNYLQLTRNQYKSLINSGVIFLKSDNFTHLCVYSFFDTPKFGMW